MSCRGEKRRSARRMFANSTTNTNAADATPTAAREAMTWRNVVWYPVSPNHSQSVNSWIDRGPSRTMTATTTNNAWFTRSVCGAGPAFGIGRGQYFHRLPTAATSPRRRRDAILAPPDKEFQAMPFGKMIVNTELWPVVGAIEQKQKTGFDNPREEAALKG